MDACEAAEDDAVFEDLNNIDTDDEAELHGSEEEEEELDPAVETSDASMIEAIAWEVEESNDDGQLCTLTQEEIMLGQFSLLKVSRFLQVYITGLLTFSFSSQTLARRFSIVQGYERI